MSAGIFRNPLGGFGLFGLGDVRTDQINACVQNYLKLDPDNYTEATARAECTKVVGAQIDCAPQCASFRPDTPEWAQCIQNCHFKAGTSKYPAVSYDSEKAKCAAESKEYSWLEGGCVDKKKFNGCPAGTMYAKYPDGSEKCIGYTTDLTKTKCPAGTTLQKVSGGEACVSPVKPGTVKAPPRTTTTGSDLKTDTGSGLKQAGAFGIPTLGWIGIAAVIGVLGYAVYSKKQKQEQGGFE